MRVVLDLRAAHPGLTGIGRYAVNLCLSLEKVEGLRSLEVITTSAGAEYLQGLLSSRVHVVPGEDPHWDDLILPDLLSRLGADIFHSPLFVLPKVQACTSLCTVHDVIPLARPDLSSAAFVRFFHMHVGRALERSSHVVTVSRFSKEDIVRFFPMAGDRVTTIPEPVSPIFSRRSPRDCEVILGKTGLRRGFILYVGAIDRRKNLSVLLEAYGLMRNQGRPVPPLIIVGGESGDGYDLPAECAMRGLDREVRLLGRVSDAELACLYSSAGVFVFPSLYEGFGLPVVEAMACGSPVVASKATSLPEIAGDAAVLVDPKNPREIGDALSRVLNNPQLSFSLREKGLARAREFSLESQGTKLVALYGRILREAA